MERKRSTWNLPPIFGNIIIPNADPQRTKARRKGTTFNRWLKKAIVNGIIGANTKPVTAPRINKLVPDKPITQTKSNQVTARQKPPHHTAVRHLLRGTYTATIAAINRPIYSKKKNEWFRFSFSSVWDIQNTKASRE